MPKATDLTQLTDRFRRLGAQDPESWARSQIDEGLPQLARFLFLRQAWRRIINEDDDAWIAAYVDEYRRRPTDPYAGVGRALESLQSKGATAMEITDLVRGLQASLLFELCYQLGDPNIEDPEAGDVAWGLFQIDDDGNPTQPIDGLHESVLETDPTGREMRPR